MSLRQMTYLRAHISWACSFACTDSHFNNFISLKIGGKQPHTTYLKAILWGNSRSRAGPMSDGLLFKNFSKQN